MCGGRNGCDFNTLADTIGHWGTCAVSSLELAATGMHLLGEGAQRKGRAVDDNLKQLMHDLGNAINDSLSDSDRIAEAIGEIRRSGYDVFLVLEATIGFNRREDDAQDGADFSDDSEESLPTKIKFTAQDERFLKALKIAIQD